MLIPGVLCTSRQANKTLQELNLWNNGIGAEGAASIAEALKVLWVFSAPLHPLDPILNAPLHPRTAMLNPGNPAPFDVFYSQKNTTLLSVVGFQHTEDIATALQVFEAAAHFIVS